MATGTATFYPYINRLKIINKSLTDITIYLPHYKTLPHDHFNDETGITHHRPTRNNSIYRDFINNINRNNL